jgi:hypothetical protein
VEFDVIAVRDMATGREKLAIQCKHQHEPVGRPDLQKLLGVISADLSYTGGVLVTSARFSGDAQIYRTKFEFSPGPESATAWQRNLLQGYATVFNRRNQPLCHPSQRMATSDWLIL